MSFPRYEKYKESRVEWLGEVPEHWEIKRLKFLTSDIKAGPFGSALTKDMYVSTGYRVYGQEQVIPNDFSIGDYYITREKYQELQQYQVITGDILISCVGTFGKIAVAPSHIKPGIINPRLMRLRCSPAVETNYLVVLLQSIIVFEQFSLLSRGGTMDVINIGTLNEILLPIPRISEQESILHFIKTETAKIDALIAEQQKLIDLLKEKRQAVISHAVTKGLNPDVPMKDSGVEWLGEVPEHWEVKGIKWLSSVSRGASPRPIDDAKYFDDDGEFAWVRIADVSATESILLETTQRLSELGSSLSVKIYPGELFVSIAGTVGKPCISGIKACIHDGFVYFPQLEISPQFLYRIFEAGTCYGGLGKWGTQLNLNTDTIGSIRVAVPPKDELTRLLAFLDIETAKIDTLTAESQNTINLLQERRTALISAAVTGKIDVRGLVAEQPKVEAVV